MTSTGKEKQDDESSSLMTKSVTVSAPGKILMVGGYLVLERPNVGWVIAANKRFYTTIQQEQQQEHQESSSTIKLVVHSPQFHSTWEYTWNTNTLELISSSTNPSTNDFIEKTLRVCFLYLKPSSLTSSTTTSSILNITIKADNEFYSILPHLPSSSSTSAGKPDASNRTPQVVQQLPPFLNCPIDPNTGKAIVNKTGLGSSAALVTSLVGALLYYFPSSATTPEKKDEDDDEDEDDDDDEEEHTILDYIHNLAQICHSYAQGKVGSGFDVSAAIHGTHVYRRFPNCLLPDLLSQLEQYQNDHAKHDHDSLEEVLQRLVQDIVPWSKDMVTLMPLPNTGTMKLQIVLADVCGGSESPSMAKNVLKWKQEQQQQKLKLPNGKIPHWEDLAKLNAQVVSLIQSLNSTTNTNHDAVWNMIAQSIPIKDWPRNDNNDSSSYSILYQLHDTFDQIRHHLKQMGEKAGVPIEPPEQTELCNATCNIPGVVTAIVPGAGGNDAIVCLYIDQPGVLDAIGTLWSNWKTPMICPLAVQASDEGLRLE